MLIIKYIFIYAFLDQDKNIIKEYTECHNLPADKYMLADVCNWSEVKISTNIKSGSTAIAMGQVNMHSINSKGQPRHH